MEEPGIDLIVVMSPDVLEDKLEHATDGKSPEATWNTRRLPTRLEPGWSNRLFVASGGFWRGYFPLSGEVLWTPEDEGAAYALILDTRGWTPIAPQQGPVFRGWRYGAPENWAPVGGRGRGREAAPTGTGPGGGTGEEEGEGAGEGRRGSRSTGGMAVAAEPVGWRRAGGQADRAVGRPTGRKGQKEEEQGGSRTRGLHGSTDAWESEAAPKPHRRKPPG